jgi:hypothetical protein
MSCSKRARTGEIESFVKQTRLTLQKTNKAIAKMIANDARSDGPEERPTMEFPRLMRRRISKPEDRSALITSMIAGTRAKEVPDGGTMGNTSGKVLFPTTDKTMWTPPLRAKNPSDGALTLELNDLDISGAQHGNNTVGMSRLCRPLRQNSLAAAKPVFLFFPLWIGLAAIEFMAPQESRRFRYV